MKISRQAYADMFGPTVGDKVRLADTDLWIEVEKDFTTYGEEVKFGGGKVIRDGMGQSQLCAAEVVDTLITNALILDHWGIVKADVGLKDGRIAAIGKAGNPDIQPDVTIAIGASTEVIAGEGMILTAGGIDSHIHFICPQQIEEALMSGVTTMIGGGTGPATGTNATTVTPGPWHMAMMLKAADAFPMNIGFTGKGNASLPEPLIEQVRAGAIGLKLHEDWGTTPAAIDNCLSVADQYDDAGGHPYRHAERIGLRRDDPRRVQGPHHPHLPHRRRRRHTRPTSSRPAASPTCCPAPLIRPGRSPATPSTSTWTCSWSATTSTRASPRTWPSPSRIRRETIAAEDILHDLGAFSMISSDSQAMGRVGGSSPAPGRPPTR